MGVAIMKLSHEVLIAALNLPPDTRILAIEERICENGTILLKIDHKELPTPKYSGEHLQYVSPLLSRHIETMERETIKFDGWNV